MCKYYENVENVNCTEEKILVNGKSINIRYLLEIKIKNVLSDEEFTVVMMNPSKANKYKSDRTINKIVKDITENFPNCSKIKILNAIPIYDPNSKSMANYLNETNFNSLQNILNKNIDIVHEHINQGSHILIGTGNPTTAIMTKIYKQVYLALDRKEIYYYDKTQKGYYYHPCPRIKRETYGLRSELYTV